MSYPQHYALKNDVQKWLCTDGKTWRAGCRKTPSWINCDDEEHADRIITEMKPLTVAEIKVRYP